MGEDNAIYRSSNADRHPLRPQAIAQTDERVGCLSDAEGQAVEVLRSERRSVLAVREQRGRRIAKGRQIEWQVRMSGINLQASESG